MLLDIHTHRRTAVPGEYILNIEPARFDPAEGGYYSVGIHPWKVPEAAPEDWEKLERAAGHPSVLAIGEAGLDKLASADILLQKEVFVRQVLLSESVGKPLVIHCVKAFNELIELKKKYRPRMPWVVHGFRNNLHIACRLMQEDALSDFCSLLLPIATLLTPNIPEAEILSGMKILTEEDMHLAAHRILNLGCRAVLIKGGHSEGNRKVDMLYVRDDSVVEGQLAARPVQRYEHETITTRNTHGTGCTLSSAIASFVARGLCLADAIGAAKKYLSEAIEAGKDVEIGKGHGPVNHLYNPDKLIIKQL